LLKIKLGGDGDGMRIAAVRKAAPDTELIVDANEAWTPADIERNLDACAAAGVTLVEQPLPPARTKHWHGSGVRSPSAPTRACTTGPRC